MSRGCTAGLRQLRGYLVALNRELRLFGRAILELPESPGTEYSPFSNSKFTSSTQK